MPVPAPAIHDDFSLLLAADTFVHGRLANPPHPMAAYLDTFHVIQKPTYSSIYQPAQEAVLAIGQLLGHPWVGILLSMAGMCVAFTWMFQGWFPPGWALVGGLLALLRLDLFSYWLEGYWGGAVAAGGAALVLGALPRVIHHRRVSDAFLMAIGAGLMANSRPVEGLIFCIPIGAVLLYWFLKTPRMESGFGPFLIVFVAVLGPVLAFMAYYNWRVTLNPLLFPHSLYVRNYTNYSIFIWQAPPPPLHYPNPQFEEFFNTWVRHEFHASWHLVWGKILDWGNFFVGSTLLIPLLAIPFVSRDKKMRLPLFLFFWCGLGLIIVVYFEPHYAAPMAVAFFILLVQAMRHMRHWELKGKPVGIFLTRLVVVLLLVRAGGLTLDAYRHPLADWSTERVHLVQQLENSPGKHLVIVRYAPDHFVHHEWVYNGADVDGSKIVWAREIPGQDMTPLLNYFHNRKVWLLEADHKPRVLAPYVGPFSSQSEHAQ